MNQRKKIHILPTTFVGQRKIDTDNFFEYWEDITSTFFKQKAVIVIQSNPQRNKKEKRILHDRRVISDPNPLVERRSNRERRFYSD